MQHLASFGMPPCRPRFDQHKPQVRHHADRFGKDHFSFIDFRDCYLHAHRSGLLKTVARAQDDEFLISLRVDLEVHRPRQGLEIRQERIQPLQGYVFIACVADWRVDLQQLVRGRQQ